MIKDFRDFVLRGNVVDLAVGIVIGAAFGAVVASFVENILTPVLAIPGSVRFEELGPTVNGQLIAIGAFLNSLISFVLIAAAVFFFVVRPVNALMARRKTEPEVADETKRCRECLSNIPLAARRCAFCTSEQ